MISLLATLAKSVHDLIVSSITAPRHKTQDTYKWFESITTNSQLINVRLSPNAAPLCIFLRPAWIYRAVRACRVHMCTKSKSHRLQRIQLLGSSNLSLSSSIATDIIREVQTGKRKSTVDKEKGEIAVHHQCSVAVLRYLDSW